MSNANCAGMPPPVAPVRRRMAAGPRSLLGPGKACPWARLRRDPRGRTRGLDLPYVLRARSCAGGVAADRRSGHNSSYMRQGTKSDIHRAMSRIFSQVPSRLPRGGIAAACCRADRVARYAKSPSRALAADFTIPAPPRTGAEQPPDRPAVGVAMREPRGMGVTPSSLFANEVLPSPRPLPPRLMCRISNRACLAFRIGEFNGQHAVIIAARLILGTFPVPVTFPALQRDRQARWANRSANRRRYSGQP
jgi:hypothetical protein